MKVKTSELSGIALDWAVVHALDLEEVTYCSDNEYMGFYDYDDVFTPYNPSEDWGQGGPIIEREYINIECPRGFGWTASAWVEEIDKLTGHFRHGGGDTPLIAAMRCCVEMKLGREVEIPEELL